MITTRPRAVTLAVVLNLVMGTTYVATKQAVDALPDSVLVSLRALVAALLLVAITGRAPLAALLADRAHALRPLLVMGSFGYALPLLLGSVGTRLSTATHGSLLIGVEPLAMVLLGALVLGERPTRVRWIALALGVAGATAVVAAGASVETAGTAELRFDAGAHGPSLLGDLLLVAAGTTWAIYTIAAKPLLGRHSPLAITTACQIVSLPFVLPFGVREGLALSWSRDVAVSLAWAVGLGVYASGLGSWLWNEALRHMDASQLAGFVFLQPLAGVLLGTLALGEPLSAISLAGGAVVLAGTYLLIAEERRAAAG